MLLSIGKAQLEQKYPCFRPASLTLAYMVLRLQQVWKEGQCAIETLQIHERLPF